VLDGEGDACVLLEWNDVAALGFFISSAVDWFTRLKEQNSNQIIINGRVKCG
jgi:hypothetical protein